MSGPPNTIWPLTAAALIAALLAILLVTPRNDAESVFGAARPAADALETGEGRTALLALIGATVEDRGAIAEALARRLAESPLIADITDAAPPPDPAVIDFIWRHRLRLAPPQPGDLTEEAMADALSRGLARLTTAEGVVLGSYLLDDPTGGFERLLTSFRSLGPGSNLGPGPGGFLSADGRGTLLFARFAERPYDAAKTFDLAQDLREITSAGPEGTRLLLIGPRLIAAETGARIERAALIASSLAGGLMLLWLLLVLRASRAVLLCLLPLALGISSAALAVQTLFGSVHVLALGFGGALTGLALDYPLHMIAHRGGREAARLVLLGAGTTSIAFLAMLGAGLPAFAQTGVFVAVGLSTAAMASRAFRVSQLRPRLPAVERFLWPLPGKLWLAGALAALGLASPLFAPERPPGGVFGLPPDLAQDLAEIRNLVDLPSGRAVLTVEAATADAALAWAWTLEPVLQTAIAEGLIERAINPARILPDRARQTVELPTAASLRSVFANAVARAGLAPSQVERIATAWDAARQAAPVSLSDLAAHPTLSPIAGQVSQQRDTWQIVIPLYGLTDPDAVPKLRALIDEARLPGVTFTDRVADLDATVAGLERKVTLWLALGAFAALTFLALAARSTQMTFRVALVSAGALGLVTLAITWIDGPPGVFQIMALTLVAGIGVDYGLFLEQARAARTDIALAARSTGLCAASTLIAFTVMALSPAPVLAEIGWTVSLGVLAMLGLHLAQDRPRSASRPPEGDR